MQRRSFGSGSRSRPSFTVSANNHKHGWCISRLSRSYHQILHHLPGFVSYLFGDLAMLIPHVRPPSCAWGLVSCCDSSETGSPTAVAEALQPDYRLRTCVRCCGYGQDKSDVPTVVFLDHDQLVLTAWKSRVGFELRLHSARCHWLEPVWKQFMPRILRYSHAV